MEKKSPIFKKIKRYLSINKSTKSSSPKHRGMFTKSRSWSGTTSKASEEKPLEKHKVAPTGCFSVYVGPEKQRFVIKTKFSNHPLFKMLLDDAELEYGFHSEGPLQIPCEVDLFYKVLAEMDGGKEHATGCGYGSCSPFSPRRRLGKGDMATGYNSSYALLTPPRLLKINQF